MGAKAVAAVGLMLLGALVVGVLRLTSGRGPSFETTGNGLIHVASNRQTGSGRPDGPEPVTTPTGAETPTPAASTPEDPRAPREDAERLRLRNIALREKVRKLERENDDLRTRNRQLRRSLLEAWDRVHSAWDGLNRTPAIETVVQEIDRKERTVVLAAGRKKRVSSGMRFHLSRDGTYVGEVRVTEVLSGRCIAAIVFIRPGMRIEIGDSAATRL